jgi:uncharacterized protein YukE
MADVLSAELAVPATLAEAPPFLRAKAASLQDQLNTLRAKLNALEPTWDSAAKDEYLAYKTMWDTAANDLMGPGGVLDVIAQTMQTVWNNYVETESANIQSWAH